MEKRILNIATFARMYFEKLGKIYDETNSKQRQAADKNFRRILKKGELDLVVFVEFLIFSIESGELITGTPPTNGL
jgi:hypothetical protein